MPMYNPPHPGGVIRRQVLEPLHLSVTEAAAALDISRKHLSDLLNERAGISSEMALRLARVFPGRSAEAWLSQQTQYDLAQARREVLPKIERELKPLKTKVA
ncbi:MAG TPA: HigA family addiction module antitoxin [Gammaproteobacteria bacterium]|nr:HigA family addiction module antitoxin [Gammaproteobacteria bacterium]